MKGHYKKRTLVTGGAGFIGSNYLNYAVKKYPDELFINIDSLTYAADLTNVSVDTASNYHFEKCDIRDEVALTHIFETYVPTAIIHFAAESHVDQSIENPGIFVETNIVGTDTLARLARESKIERFHFISTDEVYGDLSVEGEPFTELSPYNPRNPYSASKASAELILLSHFRTYGLPVVITRSSNTYGPHQDVTKLIPRFVTNLILGKKIPLYGDGKNIRSWLYVEDCVRGIDVVFRGGKIGETYNIGSDEELANIEVARILLKNLGKTEKEIEPVTDRLGHDFRYALSSAKVAQELGWKPHMAFAEGIEKTIAFYKQKTT